MFTRIVEMAAAAQHADRLVTAQRAGLAAAAERTGDDSSEVPLVRSRRRPRRARPRTATVV
ncbi:MAG: hypothetical protein ACXV3V_08640 [Actinomycetes bacterium]